MQFEALGEIADEVEVSIEVPRGSFLKRKPDGTVDFISPFPCPYNYGSIEGTAAADGDPLDVVLLGTRRPRGWRTRARVRAVMGFVDAGVPDPKIICSCEPLTLRQRRALTCFFCVYARFKGAVNRLRGRSGATRCVGWLPDDHRSSGESGPHACE